MEIRTADAAVFDFNLYLTCFRIAHGVITDRHVMVLEHADIYLVSEMPDELVRKCFLTPFSSVQAALDAAYKKLGPTASVLAMPYGGSTLPVVQP